VIVAAVGRMNMTMMDFTFRIHIDGNMAIAIHVMRMSIPILQV
jgi:hypothetical protein